MSEVTVSSSEFAAYKVDVDERMANVIAQLSLLNNKITDIQTTMTVSEFPDEEEQIREKILSAFDDEIATFGADINKLKSDVITLQQVTNIV